MPELDSTMIDDLPSVHEAAPGSDVTAAVSGAVSASMFDGVPTMGEAIPIGTYHFGVKEYSEGWNSKWDKDDSEEVKKLGFQPYFQVQWSCKQEPHTGRGVFDFVPWVNDATFKAANEGNPVARQILKDRLWKAKAILEGIGYKIQGEFDFKSVLSSNPECKLQLGLQAGKTKDATGKYVESGDMRNKILRYVPLMRPA